MANTEERVALYLDSVDIDSVFAATKHPRILQDISKTTDNIKNILFTTVDRGDPLIDNRPTCECGATRSEHGNEEVCPVCLSTVQPITERSVTPSMFVARPYGIDGFLSPYFYQALRYAFDIGIQRQPYNPFVALLGHQNPTNPIHKVVLNRMPKDLVGYNNAIKDLPRFIFELTDIIFDIVAPKERGVIAAELTKSHRKTSQLLPELYHARELAESIRHFKLPHVSNVLPVRSKLLMTLEEGNYSQTSATTDMYARAIVYLNNLPYDESRMSSREKANYRPDSRIVRFYELYSDMRRQWYAEEGGKGGGLRTDTITARSGSVMRSVQTQDCNIHDSDSIGLPYTQSIVVFLAHIVNWYEVNKQWSSNKTIQFVERHMRDYNDELWHVLNHIVQVVTEQGGVAYSIRYPSIYRTSGLTNRMAYVKKEPNDHTISVPASSLPAQAGDKRVLH